MDHLDSAYGRHHTSSTLVRPWLGEVDLSRSFGVPRVFSMTERNGLLVLVHVSVEFFHVARDGLAAWLLLVSSVVAAILLLGGFALARVVLKIQAEGRKSLREELTTQAQSAREDLASLRSPGAKVDSKDVADAKSRVKTTESQARDYLARLAVADRMQVTSIAVVLAAGVVILTVLVLRLT